MKFIQTMTMSLAALFFVQAAFANSETVNGYPTGGLADLNSYTDSSPRAIASEIKKLREYMAAHPGSALPYAYINKRSTNGAFNTYLVDLKTGTVKDTFPSLIGYNGIGCGKGQSRPGIFKLTDDVGRAAHPKPWWGNNHKYFDIANVPQGSRCGENLDNQVVAHSNRNVPNTCSARRVSSRSAGCFTTSPEKMSDMADYAGKAYIYNVE